MSRPSAGISNGMPGVMLAYSFGGMSMPRRPFCPPPYWLRTEEAFSYNLLRSSQIDSMDGLVLGSNGVRGLTGKVNGCCPVMVGVVMVSCCLETIVKSKDGYWCVKKGLH